MNGRRGNVRNPETHKRHSQLIKVADLVHKIESVKHPFKVGIMTQECIEF